MSTTFPAFTPLEDSLWLTLYARALDYRRQHSILADAMADQIVHKVDYDFGHFHIDTNLILNVALRAKKLDQVASEFLARHPGTPVGLDLGTGLDTRVFRLAPPSTVDWYDVDFPAVAAARRRLLPERPDAHVIGADVTEKDWLDTIPGQASHHRRRWSDGVPHPGRAGVAVEPAHQPLPQRRAGLQQLHPLRHLGGQARPRHQVGRRGHRQVSRDGRPRAPERWNPKLQLVREILLSREPEVDQFPPVWRRYNRLAAHSTAWSRTGTIVLHYRF